MTPAFGPIAIVGRGCVLPDALDPDALWRIVSRGRDVIGPVPGRRWRLDASTVLAGTGAAGPDETASDRGGYVRGFEQVFDPAGFALAPERLLGLDPVFQWVLHAGRAALADAGLDVPVRGRSPIGLVLGNLGYPSRSHAEFAERVWLRGLFEAAPGRPDGWARPGPDPRSRFSSGLPAHLAAAALGLGGDAFCLDAACASSLYAIKLACDRLHRGDADLMLAGAVNCPDDLFIHVGFSVLKALSPTGRSRPFHPQADGLVPAEGAALVVLERLEDALRAGHRIHGVIRGIGLSNDGRAGGFLGPSARGQVAAMQAAYAMSGIAPGEVSLLECHATGTPVGDAVEVESSAEVFSACTELPAGSHKSNFGHLIAAAGVTGLLKVLEAMRHGQRASTLHAEDAGGGLSGTPLRLVHETEPWACDGPRIAGVSAFGFGGNNAHLVVEEGTRPRAVTPSVHVRRAGPGVASDPVVIVAMDAITAAGAGLDGLTAALRAPAGTPPAAGHGIESLDILAAALRFPPHDLREALPQQLVVLELAVRLAGRVQLDPARLGVYVGMGCDPLVARHGTRWRLAARVAEAGLAASDAWLDRARDAIAAPLDPATVIGGMPNIPANRINAQLDALGPSFSVSSEELSGLRALELAVTALEQGEIDAALVGAVDFSCEPAHRAAADALLPGAQRAPGDAGVMLALERFSSAVCNGDEVLAVIDAAARGEADQTFGTGEGAVSLTPRLGHAHAASGLLHVAAAVLALERRIWFADSTSPGTPWLAGAARTAEVRVDALGGQSGRVRLSAAPLAAPGIGSRNLVEIYRGACADEVLSALRAGRSSEAAPGSRESCLAIAARDETEARARREQADAFLAGAAGSARRRVAPGVHWSPRTLGGDLGFVFTGAAAAYPGMGAALLRAMPWLLDDVLERHPPLARAWRWLERGDDEVFTPFETLQGCTLLCQAHAALTLRGLGLRPRAVLGVSSGETNGVVALEAWSDVDALFEAIDAAGMYTREIAGEYGVVRRAWGARAPAHIDWVGYRVFETPAAVTRAIGDEWQVRLSMINAPADCIVNGPSAACRRVMERLDAGRAVALGPDIVAHCPELESWRAEWRRIHDRPTRPVPGVRFYANATGGSYEAGRAAIADALTEQAVRTVDFRAVVEAAYRDGVRVFVEHGPRASCTRWIGGILGDREHLAVSLDAFGAGTGHALDSIVALAAGVTMRLDRLAVAQDRRRSPTGVSPAVPTRGGARLVVPGHWPEIRLHPPAHERPTVSGQDGEGDRPAAARAIASAPAAARPARTLGGPTRAGVAGELVELHRQLSESHRTFLRQQARAVASVGGLARGLSPQSRRRPVVMAVPETGGPDSRSRIPAHAARRAMDRAGLEVHASGRISEIFGPAFSAQDDYPRRVRMPESPLLLTDRVLGIDGESGSLGRGRIWTETDVTDDAWYLDRGRVPAGILIEAGQSDLLLISWLGIDARNRGERVYRLLGADITFHGDLPGRGDRLRFDIRVVDHARQGEVALFFFASECHVDGDLRLTVRNGQAGFFSDAELAASAGILWSPDDAACPAGGVVDAPAVTAWQSRFDAERVRAFSLGRIAACFGDDYSRADSHVRTPAIPAGAMCLLDEVTAFEPRGGPWERGYLKAVEHVDPDAWHMRGHFKHDPCMPGNLMLQAAMQAMAFYLAAMGYTLARDGWRFAPVAGESCRMRCRGQVTPGSQSIEYELFVREVSAGPEPTLYADVLGTVDGLRAFHCERLGLRLVPGFPVESRLPPGWPRPRLSGAGGGDLPYDETRLLACSWGRLSEAFDERFAVFDTARRGIRLPGPPYDFISRVTEIASQAVPGPGDRIVAEYDVPADAWYFEENGARTMPACVLLEVALQPCGCLAVHMGISLESETDLHFRNLDGEAVQHFEVRAGGCVVETRATCTSISRAGEITLVQFDVECRLAGRVVYEIRTGFGFFTPRSLASQVGIPLADPLRECVAIEGGLTAAECALAARPEHFFAGAAQLPGAMLSMLDRLTAYLPDGGPAGLGYLRAESDVRPGEWFFRAHFYEDPVQPGSLGIEAVLQVVQFYLLASGEAKRFTRPRFEPIAIGEPLTYKYRGQVTPANRRIEVAAEILERRRDADGTLVRARASFWVDGIAIYEVAGVGMRIVEDDAAPHVRSSQTLGAQVARLMDIALVRAGGGVVHTIGDVEIAPDATEPRRERGRARADGAGCFDAVLEHWDERAGRYSTHASARVLIADGYGLPEAARRGGEPLLLRGLDCRDGAPSACIGDLLDAACASLRASDEGLRGERLRSLRLYRTPVGSGAIECRASRPAGREQIVRVEVARAGEPLAHIELVSARDTSRSGTPACTPIDTATVRAFWREQIGAGAWIGEDVVLALVDQFVEGASFTMPGGASGLRSRGVVYISNHQVAVESLLFVAVLSALTGVRTAAIAKREHALSWMGRMLAALFPGTQSAGVPDLMVLVDRADTQATWERLQAPLAAVAAGRRSLLVHAEGTRALAARQPVRVLSSAIVDRCVALGLPIVPVRFAGGLPLEPAARRLDFPVAYGRQSWWLGDTVEPEALRPLDSATRRAAVLEALARTGPPVEAERPHPGDPDFASAVARQGPDVGEPGAVLGALGERHGFASREDLAPLLGAIR